VAQEDVNLIALTESQRAEVANVGGLACESLGLQSVITQHLRCPYGGFVQNIQYTEQREFPPVSPGIDHGC
jgi:hypothetical protein